MTRTFLYIAMVALLLAGAGCSFLKQPKDKSATEMTLNMKEWSWIRTIYNNDTIVIPDKPGVFTLHFGNDDKVNVRTDCNRMMGGYTAEGSQLSFSQLASTRMYCPDSQEDVFADMLSQVSSFLFTPKGELVLELKFDSGHILLK